MNPIHLDAEAAAKTQFKRPIVHGLLYSSLIATILGTKLPGPGSVYLSQQLKFRAPVCLRCASFFVLSLREVFVGDEVTAHVTVKSIRRDKGIIVLETKCVNQREQLVVEGEAVGMHDEVKAPQ